MFNKIILHGRLVRDPESFATTSGKNICKFTVANSRKFNDKEDVIFIECKVFGSKGDACFRYLKKGSECIVAGILTTEKWTGKRRARKSRKIPFLQRKWSLMAAATIRPQKRHNTQPPVQDWRNQFRRRLPKR